MGALANASADYCLVYDYIGKPWEQPSSCSVTQWQGNLNHGPVLSYYYQDNVNPSLSHTANFWYDALYRLTQPRASGNSKYFLDFNYDRYGNMTCTINGQTNGPCPEYSFSSANNRITNTGYTYDAAGDLTSDLTTVPTSAYQWDAEGHLTTITQGGSAYSTSAYNANGQMVETVYPVFGNDRTETLLDPFGRELGYYDGKMNAWFDRDFWVAGRMFAQSYPSETYFLHHNVPGSDVQLTGHSGTPTLDILYYPWGGENTHIGYESDSHFAGFEQTGGNLNPTPTRRYANPMGRWLTPDLLGGGITNPQSLNRYAYALNNPTTLTDPSGLNACNEFNTSYEGSGLPFPCNNCPSSGACGTSNNPSGPGPVTIDSNGDPLSSDISEGEANYASNFGWLIQGSLYGHGVQPTFFSSLDAYFNWRTDVALQPQNQAYGLFSTAANQENLDPSKTYTVKAYYQGLEMNIQVQGVPLDTSLLPFGSVQDPFTFTHNGNTSYFQLWSLFDSSHYVADPSGFGFHQDLFGPLNPPHYVDWAAGSLLGRSPTMTFICQMGAGCY
ncbi:MAG TPA: RHS repeat-associated core domain-containing protein [Terriglobia bacterium]|nr:RHS repeat-associated core domain-containing protein [Terriglobia bacterium]